MHHMHGPPDLIVTQIVNQTQFNQTIIGRTMNNLIKTSLEFNIFTSQWAKSSQSHRCKSTLINCDEYICDDRGRESLSKGTGVHRKPGWMQAEHHILYNLVRDKEPTRGFTPATKHGKDNAYRHAYIVLQSKHQLAKKLQEPKKVNLHSSYETYEHMVARNLKSVTTFLEPFSGSLTLKQFAEMDLPQYADPLTWVPVDPIVKTPYNTINTESHYN